MNTELYRVGHRDRTKQKRHRRKVTRRIFLIMLALIAVGIWWLLHYLKPHTELKQARAVTTKVAYNNDAIKHYTEPDFAIDLPSSWQLLPRPAGPYNTYNWQRIAKSQGELITVYEDTIPVNFAVNRVLIIEPQVDHISLKGSVSDNCSQYTTGTSTKAYNLGAPAKWQNISFLCDQNNQERDVLGTSSTDGINVVNLKNPSTGQTHKFFFTYTDHSLNPDYSVFSNTLTSFHLQ